MNKFFRVIWSQTLNCMIVVPEVGKCSSGKRHGRGQRSRVAARTTQRAGWAGLVMAVSAQIVQADVAPQALPQNGRVAAGQAVIGTQMPGAMVISTPLTPF